MPMHIKLNAVDNDRYYASCSFIETDIVGTKMNRRELPFSAVQRRTLRHDRKVRESRKWLEERMSDARTGRPSETRSLDSQGWGPVVLCPTCREQMEPDEDNLGWFYCSCGEYTDSPLSDSPLGEQAEPVHTLREESISELVAPRMYHSYAEAMRMADAREWYNDHKDVVEELDSEWERSENAWQEAKAGTLIAEDMDVCSDENGDSAGDAMEGTTSWNASHMSSEELRALRKYTWLVAGCKTSTIRTNAKAEVWNGYTWKPLWGRDALERSRTLSRTKGRKSRKYVIKVFNGLMKDSSFRKLVEEYDQEPATNGGSLVKGHTIIRKEAK